MRAPLGRAIEHARRSGNRSMEIEAMTFVLASAMFGSTPVADGIQLSQDILENASDSRELHGWAVRTIGTLLMLDGKLDEAREHIDRARAIFTELGNNAALVGLAFSAGPLELWAGDASAAEREGRRGLELAQRIGDRGRTPNLAALVVDALIKQGRLRDAQEYVELGRETTLTTDPSAEALWRIGTARLLVRTGQTEDAVKLAKEAMEILLPTQESFYLSTLLLVVAEVLQLAERKEDEAEVLRQARRFAEHKGATFLVGRADERLSQLTASRP